MKGTVSLQRMSCERRYSLIFSSELFHCSGQGVTLFLRLAAKVEMIPVRSNCQIGKVRAYEARRTCNLSRFDPTFESVLVPLFLSFSSDKVPRMIKNNTSNGPQMIAAHFHDTSPTRGNSSCWLLVCCGICEAIDRLDLSSATTRTVVPGQRY
jgi:hypothetical protein